MRLPRIDGPRPGGLLPGEAKVLVFVEANAHVTHVLSLMPQAVRQLIVRLLDALDVATLEENSSEAGERG